MELDEIIRGNVIFTDHSKVSIKWTDNGKMSDFD
jgi:hypothetical protein